MSSVEYLGGPARRLLVPTLGRVYASLSGPSEALLRVVAGIALVVHGSSKIVDPFGAAGMVEGLGFYPGAFWSLLLSITEFFGGILLTFGILTRFAALGGMVVLLVTVWFHWIVQGQGYSGAELSILWAAICFFFVVHGGRYLAVDRLLGHEL